MPEGITVASSTDTMETVNAVAGLTDDDGRVPEPEPGDPKEAGYEKPDQTRVDVREAPHSTRQRYLATLEEAEKELAADSSAANDEEEESAPAEQLTPPDDAVLEQVRRRAADDAVADARRRMGLDNQPQLSPEEQALNRKRAELAVPFQARLRQLIPEADLTKLVNDMVADKSGDVAAGTLDAILAIPGGAEVYVQLLRDTELRKRLAAEPEHLQIAHIGQLAARAAQPAARKSAAPAPIRPVGGSGTRTAAKDPDEMTYQEYRQWRNATQVRK